MNQVISFDLSWLKRKPHEVVIGLEIDYYRLFYALKQENSSCYLFESLELPKHQDRYFTIGFDPCLEFIAKGDQLTITGNPEILSRTTGVQDQSHITLRNGNPYEFIRKNIQLNHLSKTHQGGLIGFFSYESVNYFEPSMNLPEHADFPTFHLGLYQDGCIYDTETNILYYYTYYEDRSEYIKQLVRQLDSIEIPTYLPSAEFLGHSETKEEYSNELLNTLEEVRAGNTLQCEVGFKSFYEIKGDKIAVYDRLRNINPSPYMYYVQFGDTELLGASPEILVSSINGRVLTTPTAGTRPRGKNEQEDKQLARELLSDNKEIAEHNMLIDLHRNDLSKVCKVGSVKVAQMMYVIRFSHVQHIVSDIVGELAAEKTVYDLLAAILPGGVVTGAPKIETMKIIHQNESTPRGPYGGAVGRFSFNGDATFCLPIRSLFCKGEHCFSQTSSGVVYDSTVDHEYKEVRAKLAAMEQTIRELGGGIAVEQGSSTLNR